MSQKVSEAFHLFRLEHRYDLGEIPDTSSIHDYQTFKAHHLLPEIPPVWSSSTSSLASREITSEPSVADEFVFDFYINHFLQRILKNIEKIIREDLALRLAPIPLRELKGLDSTQKIYEFLRQKFNYIQPHEIEQANREEQEIYAIRLWLLNKIPLLELRKEGQQLKEPEWSPDELTQTIKEHYDLVFNLLLFELSRVQMEFNFSSEQKKKLLEWSDKNSIVDIQPRSAILFRPPPLPNLDNTLLRPAKQELARIKDASERIGIPMSHHQAQTNKLTSIGINVISNIYKFFSGDIIAKVGAVSGFVTNIKSAFILRGKVRLDLASRRYKDLVRRINKTHKAVVAGINLVLGELHHIGHDLVILAENQKILENRLIITLKNLETFQRYALASLAKISHDVFLSRLALNAMLDRPGMLCSDIRSRMQKDPSFHSYFNRFVSYESFKNFYEREKLGLREGLNGLFALFLSPVRNDIPLVISAEETDKNSPFHQHYRELWKEYHEAYRDWNERQLFELLLQPHTEGNSQLSSPTDLPEWISDIFESYTLFDLLTHPYDTQKLLDYGRSAHVFYYFYELLEDMPGGPLVTPEKFETHRPLPDGLRMLQNAFLRVAIGIAQANMLVGCHLLPTLHYKMQEKDNEEIRALIGNSYLLAHNVMIYSFRKSIEEKGRSYTDYYFAYCSVENPYYLESLLGTHWKFIWDKDKKFWGIQFSEDIKAIPLPEPAEIINGSFTPHPYLGNLFQLRTMLLQEMAGYQPLDLKQNSDRQSNSYYLGIVLTTVYFRNFINKTSGETHGNTSRKLSAKL